MTILAACTDYGVHVYVIPPSGATGNKVSPKETPMNFQSTGKVASGLCLSLDGSMLGVGGRDGSLSVAPIDNLGNCATVSLHDSLGGGTAAVCLVPDRSAGAVNGACLAYTCGAEGGMFLTTVTPGGYGAPPVPAIEPPLPVTVGVAEGSFVDTRARRRPGSGTGSLEWWRHRSCAWSSDPPSGPQDAVPHHRWTNRPCRERMRCRDGRTERGPR